MDIIGFDSFEPDASIVTPDDEDALRRFTVLLDQGSISTGFHHVRKVTNTSGEAFALKTLRSLDSTDDQDNSSITPTSVKAFFEEYRNQAAVAQLPGFPRAYGYGFIRETPAFLMEWVEGITLQDSMTELKHANDGQHVSAEAVASIGKALGEILLRTQNLEFPFAHRDISTRNIMIRTSRIPLDRQIERNRFDLFLIDMGSSSYKREDTTFTMRTDIWRNGTPEFAPPEMLTSDIPELARLRTSPKIDSYELCSVLYTLYTGHTPFRLFDREIASPYVYKRDNSPQKLEPRTERDETLTKTIMAGIHADQSERIAIGELTGRFEAWLDGIDFEPRTPLPTDFDAKRAGSSPDESSNGEKRHPLLSRRTALAVGGVCLAGVAASGVITRGWGIVDRLEGIKPALGDYSWAELKGIAKQIEDAKTDAAGLEIAERYRLTTHSGTLTAENTKSLHLADGTKVEVQIIGFRQDILASDPYKTAGITFLFRTPIGPQPMNQDPAQGGWEQSSLRSWMNDKLMSQLPHELSSRIVAVKKTTNNIGATTSPVSLTATEDRLWIPSMSELCGVQGPETFESSYRYLSALYSNEGSEYLLFDQLKTSGLQANSALVRSLEGEDVYWWERTPSPDVSMEYGTTYFNRVGREGDVFNHAASGNAPKQKTYVIAGFCL